MMWNLRSIPLIAFWVVFTLLMGGCGQPTKVLEVASPIPRETKISPNAVKVNPATDDHPPQVLTLDYEQPIPVPGSVNTAGAEDSPFITPDGNTLYFFFTPDANLPAEKQLFDGVTGLYVSNKVDDRWGSPERIILQDKGRLALDGCEFVQGDIMWFCSAREGYEGIHWFTAEYTDGRWQKWSNADFDPDFKVGELHITSDGNQLYFASDRPGSKGGLDVWVSNRANGEWGEPVNVAIVNTPDNEGWPAISPDGMELWFYRNYAIWRSKSVGGEWQIAEQIASPMAGEPALDSAGNLYFVHHFYQNGSLVEADIYIARKK
jgi:hypothetical protein